MNRIIIILIILLLIILLYNPAGARLFNIFEGELYCIVGVVLGSWDRQWGCGEVQLLPVMANLAHPFAYM